MPVGEEMNVTRPCEKTNMACRREEARVAPVALGHYYVVIPSLKCLGALHLLLDHRPSCRLHRISSCNVILFLTSADAAPHAPRGRPGTTTGGSTNWAERCVSRRLAGGS